MVKQVNKSGSTAFLMQSGLVICLNPDCKIHGTTLSVFNNTNTTTENYADKSSLPLIVGPTVGILCSITILLLIIVCKWVIYRRYECSHYYICSFVYALCN